MHEPNPFPQVFVRTAGVLALIGGGINAVSDYLLQGGLIARSAVNTYVHLPFAPYELVEVGSIIGNLALPLWLLGFVPLYVALAPAGRWLSVPPIFCLGYAFSLFPGYHGSYALYAAGFQAEREASMHTADALSTLVERMHGYHDMVSTAIGMFMVVGSIWFVAAILSKRTHFRLWILLLTPILAPATQMLVEMLPAPYGGYIRPAWGTTLFSLLFLAATVTTWNLGRSRKR